MLHVTLLHQPDLPPAVLQCLDLLHTIGVHRFDTIPAPLDATRRQGVSPRGQEKHLFFAHPSVASLATPGRAWP